MARARVPISNELAAQVSFASDRTCCVCQIRGKPTQIHHIDEDPAHNKFNNLAVLCLECHHQTQISGGFSRNLNSTLVTKYRDEWLAATKSIRLTAKKDAVALRVGKPMGSPRRTNSKFSVSNEEPENSPERTKQEYVAKLPQFREALRRNAQKNGILA